MNESRHRISKTAAACMIIVAVIFDVAQIASKLLLFIGLTTLTTAAGAAVGSKVGLTGTGAAVGAAAGAAVALTGIGTVITLKVGFIMAWLASLAFMLTGYATLYFWFYMKGISVLSGKSAGQKAALAFVAFLVDSIPLVNALPGITTWTIGMIAITRLEDSRKDMAEQARYNEEDDTEDMRDFSRVRRGPKRRYVHADTF